MMNLQSEKPLSIQFKLRSPIQQVVVWGILHPQLVSHLFILVDISIPVYLLDAEKKDAGS